MKIPEEQIQEITDKIDILEVVGSYLTLKRAGRSYVGLCPFHNEKTPSFNVDPEKKFFHCFGCGKGGSVFKFLMEMEGLSFVEAAEKLAQKTGVVLRRDGDWKDDGKIRSLQEVYRRVSGSLHYLLTESPQGAAARGYLERRGVTGEMIRRFELGYAPEDSRWLHKFLRGKEYSQEFLETTGLFSQRNPEVSIFWDRLMFPIKSPSGVHIGFGGRSLKEGGPKYINSPETPLFTKRFNLYGLSEAAPEIRKEKEFILAEGYLDVIAFFQAEIPRAVAPLGTAFTPEQARILRRYAQKGLIVFDGDSAGKAAADKAVRICEAEGISTQVVIIPQGKDPADILLNEGPQALHKLLKSSINNFEYLISRALGGRDFRIPEVKESVLAELAPYLDEVESRVRRESMIKELSEILEVEYQSVEADIRRLAKKTGIATVTGQKKEEKVSKELYLMMAVAANQVWFSYVRDNLKLEELSDPRAKEIYIILEENYRSGITEDLLLPEKIEDENLVSLLTAKFSSEEFTTNPELLIRQSMLEVKRENIIKVREGINRRLAKIRREGGDADEEHRLLSDKMFLDRESEKLRMTGNDGSTN